MNMLFRGLSFAVLSSAVGFAVVPAVAHSDEVVVQKTGKHHYVYYGDHEIYFAPETKVYYWRHGDRWESGATLPTEYRTYVTSGGFELDLDTERPYERHEWVIKHYKDRDHDH